ncbi:hypothetical protein FQZ97_849740 [compost metagenome]
MHPFIQLYGRRKRSFISVLSGGDQGLAARLGGSTCRSRKKVLAGVFSEVKETLAGPVRTQVNPARNTDRLQVGQGLPGQGNIRIVFAGKRQHLSEAVVIHKLGSAALDTAMQVIP